MMTVIQIMTQAKPCDVVGEYNTLFPESKTLTLRHYEDVLSQLRQIALVRCSDRLEIARYTTKHDDPVDDENIVDVSLVDEEGLFGLMGQPLGSILAAPVICDIEDMSLAEKAAHLYREITFFGPLPERDIFEDSLRDNVEKFERDTSSFKPLDDLLSSLFSQEELVEIELSAQRSILNRKTQKIFKNGKPTDIYPNPKRIKM